MAVLSPHISIITINVNGLYSPIKRHRVAGWIKKQDPTICCLQETHLGSEDKHRLRVKGWKMILQGNRKQKKAGIAIFISDKAHKKRQCAKEGWYIMIKGTVQQEEITFMKIYAPNTGVPKYIKQLLTDLKEETDSNTMIVGDLNTLQTSMHKCCLQETHLGSEDKHRLRVKGWKMILQGNRKQKKAGIAIFISDKAHKKRQCAKEGWYIMIKGTVQQEEITFMKIYAPNTGVPKYIKQLLTDLKEETDSNTMIVGDLNTLQTSMHKSSRQKVNKEIMALNETVDQMDLLNIYKTFPKIDYMLGNEASLSKFKKTEIISSIFSDHNTMKLEISYKKKAGKATNMWRLNDMILNNHSINEE
uniref:exodeoxyribonuclease III n=1 Tax=Equus asinus asinus TaxID=83772 RepID=A0A8C4KZ24_EQUAS